jgi:hypothetical protein
MIKIKRRRFKIALIMFLQVVDHSGVPGAELVARTSLGGWAGSRAEYVQYCAGTVTTFPGGYIGEFGEFLNI